MTPKQQNLSDQVKDQIEVYEKHHRKNHQFAFWHDVGVTGLGAVATALLGLTEIAEGAEVFQDRVRGAVLFITAAITVFGACSQFFRFRERQQKYALSLAGLHSIQRKLALADSSDATTWERLASSFEEAAALPEVEPSGSIWGSTAGRIIWGLVIGGVVLLLVWLIVLAASGQPPAS